MKKVIDGVQVVDGVEMLAMHQVSLLPIIRGMAEVLGDDVMNAYLKECLGEEAHFYPDYADIGLGDSKGWAKTAEQLALIQHIVAHLTVKETYNYKQWCGKFAHILCS